MLGAFRTGIRAVGHEHELSTVGHLDELRTRLIVSLAVIGVAFGFCFWQNNRLLRIIDRPLAHQTQAQVRAGHGPLGATYTVAQSARDVARQLDASSACSTAPPAPDRIGEGCARARRTAASSATSGDCRLRLRATSR